MWRIRYLDSRDRQFKDRDLWLDTHELDPATRAAVEMCYELSETTNKREMLRYRHVFHEQTLSAEEISDLCRRHGRFASMTIPDYFEDEEGNQLSDTRMAAILSGSEKSFMVPPGAKQHDIDYMLAPRRAIPLEQIVLTEEQLLVLGYFTRDVKELLASAFYREGPGTLNSVGGRVASLATAVTDEELRSFIMVFRRLYMEKEPANFVKAAAAFVSATGDYPLTKWVEGGARCYQDELEERPDIVPFLGEDEWPFSRKRLIDVFLYTRFAHQPDVRRVRQFDECLAASKQNTALLTWLFLNSLWVCGLRIRSVGGVVAGFYDQYCQHRGIQPRLLPVRGENPGLGILEKRQARRDRIMRERADALAQAIWIDRGSPSGGHVQFIHDAERQLRQALGY